MYAIEVTPNTREFIAKYLNDGVIPDQWIVSTFFVFGDDKPGKLMTARECAKGFGPKPKKDIVVLQID
jgi:hypothetical protein